MKINTQGHYFSWPLLCSAGPSLSFSLQNMPKVNLPTTTKLMAKTKKLIWKVIVWCCYKVCTADKNDLAHSSCRHHIKVLAQGWNNADLKINSYFLLYTLRDRLYSEHLALFPVLSYTSFRNNWLGLTWYGSLVKHFPFEDASLVDTSFDKESHRHYVVIFMVFIHLEMNLETTFDLLCFWRRMNSGSWQNARVQNSTCKK